MKSLNNDILAALNQPDRTGFEEEIAQEAEAMLKQNLKVAIPTAAGLFPHEILMLYYAHDYQPCQIEFPKFWMLHFGVYYPEEILDSLADRAFLTIDESTNHYQLTSQGQQELNQYRYIPFVYEHPFCNMGIWTAYQLAQESPTIPFRDIVWRRYNSFCIAYLQSRNFTGYRNIRYNMVQFLMMEHKYESALKILFEIAYLDLSGLGHSFSAEKLASHLDSYFPYAGTTLIIGGKAVNDIQEILRILQIDRTSSIQLFQQSIAQLSLPYHLFTHEECLDILLYTIYGETNIPMEKIYQIAETRVKELLAKGLVIL